MITISRTVAVAFALALSSAPFAMPSVAQAQAAGQCTNFTIAKLVRQGTTTQSVAGRGVVKIQVQVNADGTAKAMKVISSTNSGDNAAAMDIANNSTYKPATCSGKSQTTFYDFQMKFNGKSATADVGNASTRPIEAAIRAGHYDDAISKANAALLASPGDQGVLQLLAIAQYYDKQTGDAAATFDKVTNVSKNYAAIAASAFADAAVAAAPKDPASALSYANKAVALAPNSNSRFALGVAQAANKDYADAITTLKAVRAKSTDSKTSLAIDRQLLSAYLNSNDTANADATAADMKTLDPSGNAASLAMASHYLEAGNTLMNAKNFADAQKQFDLAIKTGAPEAQVTANTDAAFAELSMPKPDYGKAEAYAEKALAANGNSAEANYAAGVAAGNLFATSKKAADRTKALSYLNKADGLAKAAGNMGLALQIEQQIKNIPQ